MQDQDLDLVREFLVETHENLARLDQELVELEEHPADAALLGSIFRTFHTIKGTCGFLAFSTLEKITHHAENLLSQLRDGRRDLNPPLVTLILETVDATRRLLAAIEAGGEEGPQKFEELIERLRKAAAAPPPGNAPPEASSTSQPEEATKEEPAELSPSDAAKPPVGDANIRVGVGLLEKLMDLVGELVLARNQILQFNNEREDDALNATSQRLNLITTELQEGVMKARMQPIGMVWNKLPRVVRDVAVALGKHIRLEMDGSETELDRTIIEAIKDPLVHLVRNSCDHGIEPPEVRLSRGKPAEGILSLRAYHEGGQVNIEIADDGDGVDVARVRQKAIERGLLRSDHADKLSDREVLNLIFQPGFSTAKTVTNVSGRGVGMDVVKNHIEKIGGVVDLFSRPGEGTTVKLKIPLTLAIIPGLVVGSGGERFIIPQVSLLELIRLERDSAERHIEYVHGTPVYRRRGSLLPIAYLNQVLGLETAERAEAVNVVVLQAEDRQFGLVVDGIHDTQEIVVKPLGKQLKGLTVYAGATIMGDGRVALILDVLGIGQRSGVVAESREQARSAAEQKVPVDTDRQRLLLFRAGSFELVAVPLSMVARLEEFALASIERAGGQQVVQYRDGILPLISLRTLLEPDSAECRQTGEMAQVIVFNDGDRNVGLVVDQIVDIAEEAVTARQQSQRKGLLGSAVVGKRVVDFLDLQYVVEAARKDWFQHGVRASTVRSILLAEPSSFSRGLIRSGLEIAGYRVVEAANTDEAIRGLEQESVGVVMASFDLPPHGAAALLDVMHRRSGWDSIPVVGLAATEQEARITGLHSKDFQQCQVKFDREALLETVTRLVSAGVAEEVHHGQ